MHQILAIEKMNSKIHLLYF